MLGFPIRTPSDQRSVGSSPRHIAASHVLHRPLMPRHPPCALKHLRTKPIVKQESKLHINTQENKNQRPESRRHILCALDARNHYPRIKHHTPPPKPVRQQQPPPRNRGVSHPHTEGEANGPVVSGPNSVSGHFFTPRFSHQDERLLYAPTDNPLQAPAISQP